MFRRSTLLRRALDYSFSRRKGETHISHNSRDGIGWSIWVRCRSGRSYTRSGRCVLNRLRSFRLHGRWGCEAIDPSSREGAPVIDADLGAVAISDRWRRCIQSSALVICHRQGLYRRVCGVEHNRTSASFIPGRGSACDEAAPDTMPGTSSTLFGSYKAVIPGTYANYAPASGRCKSSTAPTHIGVAPKNL
jgi:hypothetical protein